MVYNSSVKYLEQLTLAQVLEEILLDKMLAHEVLKLFVQVQEHLTMSHNSMSGVNIEGPQVS